MPSISNLITLSTATGNIEFPVVDTNINPDATRKATFTQLRNFVAEDLLLDISVTSVAGRTGDVTLSYTDVTGLDTIAHIGLTTATTATLGGVIIGSHLSIEPGGLLSADNNITSSTTPPADPLNGTLWYDTNSGRLFVYLDSSWIDSSPLIATSIPLASTSTVGGVKIGNGLLITEDGTLSSNAIFVTTATDVDLGLVKIGTGLSVTDTGTISLNIASYDNIGGVKIGTGLLVNEQGVLFASTYSGNVLSPYLIVNLSYGSPTGGLQIYRGPGNANSGLVWSENDIISNGVTSTTGSFRLVVGDRYSTLTLDNIRTSTATTELNIFGTNNPTNVISVRGTTNYHNQVTQDYHIPNKRYVDNKFATTATTATVGVVKIGTGISITSDGTISATTATAYVLPTASVSTSGGVKVDGTSITINNGIISAANTITTATSNVLGLVKIGSGVSITSDGTISVSTASGGGTTFTGGSVTSSTQFLSNTASTSTTTGAVTIAGGLGVQGSVNVGNTVTAMSFISNTTGVPEVYSASNLNLVAVGRVQVTQSPFKVWNVTTGQRNSIPAANGDLIYNTDTNKFQGYANGTWVDLN
jgi:hypothetical protein